MLAYKLIRYYLELSQPRIPAEFNILYPYQQPEVIEVVTKFFKKYYSDEQPRKLILGINPGRFGAGITGINFTAPRQLRENCKIEHPWENSSELSAEFIYRVIDAYGGPDLFYSNYFLGAMSPLGYTKGGKNINYYDESALLKAVEPFIISSINEIIRSGILVNECICIGGGKNAKFLKELNSHFSLFKEIHVLPHPRFVMQYRRKQMNYHIDEYIEILRS